MSSQDEVPRVVDALDAIRREFRMGAPSEIDALLASWDDLVGAALAAHSRPQTVRGGVLVVLADAAAWAGQLRYLDQVLVQRIADELPQVTVREVRVSVAREPARGPEKRAREPDERPTLLVDFRQWQ